MSDYLKGLATGVCACALAALLAMQWVIDSRLIAAVGPNAAQGETEIPGMFCGVMISAETARIEMDGNKIVGEDVYVPRKMIAVKRVPCPDGADGGGDG